MPRTLLDVWREGGDLWLAVVFHPKDRVTGAARTLLFTDAPALYTSPSETPPNARFITRLMSTWRLKRALAAAGNLTGPSSIDSAGFDIENGDGSLTAVKSLVWSDQPFEVYMGAARGPAGEPLTFSDFLQVFSGVTKDCRGTSVLSISAVGRKASLDNPLVQDYYRGFGMGVFVPGDGVSRLAGTASSDHNATGALTIIWVGRLTGNLTLGGGVTDGWTGLYRVSNFYGLIVDTDFRLGFVTGATASDTSSVQFTDYVIPTYADVCLAGVVASDGVSVTLYAREGTVSADQGFRPGLLQEVGTLTMPVPLSKTDSFAGIPSVGLRGSGMTAVAIEQHVYEIQVRDEALDFDELFATSERPLPARGEGVSNLVDAWRFAEATGTVALSEIEKVDLTLEGSCSWQPSLDGDDPAVFESGVLGQTKPTCFGPVFHFPLVLLDGHTEAYGWRAPDLDTGPPDLDSGRNPSFDIWGRLRANGAPLVPDETIAPSAFGCVFGARAAGDSVVPDPQSLVLSGLDALTGLPITAKRLIPRQISPLRDGQRIDVTGSATNNGTYRVTDVNFNPDPYAWNVAVDVAFSDEIVTTSGVIIRTHPDERQFTYDLTNSTVVVMADDQAGAFGLDVTGGIQDAYLASELFAVVADGPVNTDGLLWNPPLAIGHPLNDSTTRKAMLDAIALSAMAWWVEDEDGVFRLITIRPPVGSPARRFRSEILSIRSIASTDPFSRISVGHSRNYLVLDAGNIPSSVPANMRSRLSSDYLLAPRSAKPATLKNFPQSRPRPEPFPTYLVDTVNAETWLGYAEPMFLEERLWWEITLAGAWIAAAVKAGDEHEFVHASPTGKFEGGAAARVMSVSVDKRADRTVLEVVT